jgi:beta-lactamase regulating signal transducer with metallopeptidase domain
MSLPAPFSPASLAFVEASVRFVLLNWGVQATCWLAAGLVASRLPRLRPAVRHALLLTSLVAAVSAPVALAVPGHLQLPVYRVALRGEASAPARSSALVPVLREVVARGESQPWSNQIGLGLAAVWLLLALARLGRLGVGSWLVARWGRGATPVDRSRLFDACRYHVADIPVLEADGVSVPTVVGVFQSRILLPRGMAEALSPELLGHVLLHEEAHVRRRDPLWLLLAEIAQALLCWHPLAAWSCRSLARAAEDACDARVLGHGAKGTSYARTLLTVLERSGPAPRLGVACPLGSAGAELRRRVGQILQGTQPASRVMAGLAAGAVAVSGAAATSVQVGDRPVLSSPVSRSSRVAVRAQPVVRARRVAAVQPARAVVLTGRPVDARRPSRSQMLPGAEAVLAAEPELANLMVRSPREGRTLVFLLDNSSSMRPFQAEARADILAYVEQLAPGDRFNVIAFASDVSQFSAEPLAPSEETLAGVRAWMGALPEAHGSNLGAGMLQALATPDLTSLLIYSDGKPTGSVTDPNSLGELIARENHAGAQVLSVAFGAVMNSHAEFLPSVVPAPMASPSVQTKQSAEDELLP